MILFVVVVQWINLQSLQFGSILGFASSITPSQIIEQTNQQREKNGLSPLSISSELSQAALSKGQHMMSNQYWSHVAPDGTEPWIFISQSGYSYKVAGENLARDFDITSRMISAWMASTSHRSNILNSRYTDIGVAVIDGSLQGVETTLVVQMFGHPSSNANKSETAVTSGVTITNELSQDVLAVTSTTSPEVLSSMMVPITNIDLPPLLTPIQILKAVFLSLIMILGFTLTYDLWVSQNNRTVRVVGKNLAHLLFLSSVAFLVIFFRAGLIN
jgi:hypothetical protein